MSEQEVFEQRLSVLEREVAAIKRVMVISTQNSTNWVESISGSMMEFPEFDEVAELGREWRQGITRTSQQD